MRTTSWISLTWFWMRPTWPRRSEVVTLMSAAGPAARGAAISSDGHIQPGVVAGGSGARVGCSIIAANVAYVVGARGRSSRQLREGGESGWAPLLSGEGGKTRRAGAPKHRQKIVSVRPGGWCV